jgi:futalosine hydrolase
MKTIVITSATFAELSRLVEHFRARLHPDSSPWEYFVSSHDGKRVVLAVTGIGAANAAAATTALIHIFSPDLIINTGCAGAYAGSGLAIGDLAMATSEVFAEEGVETREGWRSMEYLGIPLLDLEGRKFFNEVSLSRSAADRALAGAARYGIPLMPGRFLTVCACSGTAARGEELRTRFGAICENMEGAAVALVAARYAIDCLEVRGVSNRVEDRDLSRWDIPLAVANAANLIERLVEGS